MRKYVTGFVAGIIIGALITGVAVWNIMPSMMLEIKQSKLPFEETVSFIEKSATQNGWQVPKIYDIQKSLEQSGYSGIGRLKILSMCQPDHAHRILVDVNNRGVSSMMPCRVGVFEDDNGNVFVSRMNIGLMSKMFGGTIESVMGVVAEEENRMMEEIILH